MSALELLQDDINEAQGSSLSRTTTRMQSIRTIRILLPLSNIKCLFDKNYKISAPIGLKALAIEFLDI